MKTLFILLLICCTLIVSLPHDEIYYINAFTQFKKDYSIVYPTLNEEQHRFEIFKENLDWINQHNSVKRTYTVGMNKFGDITNKEYREMYVEWRN